MTDDTAAESGRLLVALLEDLSKGDRITVDCHDSVLRVHSTEEFIGSVLFDAYDEDGGHWPVASVDGDVYLGYSQLEPADDQSRAKRIEDVEIVDQQDTPPLVPDGGEDVGRGNNHSFATDRDHDYSRLANWIDNHFYVDYGTANEMADAALDVKYGGEAGGE